MTNLGIVSLLLLLLLPPVLSAQDTPDDRTVDLGDADHLPAAEFAARRKRVLELLDGDAAMVVRSAEPQVRSGDVRHRYRQRSNMLYLTGVTEDESALLLVPRGIEVGGRRVHEVLFVAKRNPMIESWEGARMGPAAARQITGVESVLPYGDLSTILDSILPGISLLYYDGWLHRAAVEPILGDTRFWEQEVVVALRRRSPSLQVRGAGSILDDLRAIKSPAEIALLRRGVEISMEGHRRAMILARPGMYEYEIKALMEYEFRRRGSESPGYPSIVGSGPNSTVLHYPRDRRLTADGDLVLMDCGAEYHGYSSDITRTFPIGGRFSSEQRSIYDIVLRAHELAIRACRPGADFRKPHVMALRTIAAGLVALGIIADEAEVGRYFSHGTSHYIGLDVHDVGSMGTLRPGMVLTVEPGIYIREGSPCDPKWWNIGVRIEDDILITDGGHENLSAGLVRSADEIEALVQSGRKGEQ